MRVPGKRAGLALTIVATLLLGACHKGGDAEPPRLASAQASAAPEPAAAALAALGKRIFFDPMLSASGKMACATCHSPDHAYGPPNGMAAQMGGALLDVQGLRAVPSLRYVLNRTPRWTKQFQADAVEREIETDSVPTGGFARDGRFDSLRQQALGPLLDPAEMANADEAAVVAKLRRAPYAAEFERVFGAGALAGDSQALARMLQALERFELDDVSFHPYSSKFDRHLAGTAQLDKQESRGLQLFSDPRKGNCAACHTVASGANGSPPLFTDFGSSALGVPRNPRLAANADPRFFDLGLCGPLRSDQVPQRTYCGMFKTPTLRNVATRRVLMHNGVFRDLADAVRFYAERETRSSKWYPAKAGGKVDRYDDLPQDLRGNVDVIDAPMDRKAGDKPALTEADVQDIVAFLRTLTDDDARPVAPATR